jgi:hypothetical protein
MLRPGKDWSQTAAPQVFGVNTRAGLADFLNWDRSKDLAQAEEAYNMKLQQQIPKAKL